MSWAFCGKVDGREVGYGIAATCDAKDCDVLIDRGLGYICGEMHHGLFDAEPGCGRYFCGEHGGGMVGPRGGCDHRQKVAYGRALCQRLRDLATKEEWCACGIVHELYHLAEVET